MRTETLHRWKDTGLVLLFLLFLFCFSHSAREKLFTTKDHVAFTPTRLSAAKAVIPVAPLVHHVALSALKSLISAVHVVYFRTADLIVATAFSSTKKEFLQIKPQLTLAFYYRLFSFQNEIPA